MNLTKKRTAKVASIKEASEAVRNYIDRPSTYTILGGTAWARGLGSSYADVRNEAGEVVARISYNGRAWSPSGAEIVL